MKIRFGVFTLDSDVRQVLRPSGALHLTPKAYELLAVLVADRPKVLSKTELQERLWPDTFVAEANLSNLIAEIRDALGDSARTPSFIRTAHGYGYAFCGHATVAHDDSPEERAPVCWLEWGEHRFPLAAGDHVIGRDPDVGVRLDASTVSRRHARLIVTPDSAVLEDFGSKNGTFHKSLRVRTPVAIDDGDVIHIGSVLVTFHRRSPLTSTETQGITH